MSITVYTLQEAADILRVPYHTVCKAIRDGRWPHVMVSPRRRLMTEDDIKATLELLHKDAVEPPSKLDVKMQKRAVLKFLEEGSQLLP